MIKFGNLFLRLALWFYCRALTSYFGRSSIMKSTVTFNGMTVRVKFASESVVAVQTGVEEMSLETRGSSMTDEFSDGEYEKALDAGSKLLGQLKADIPDLITNMGHSVLGLVKEVKELEDVYRNKE